MRRIDVVAVVTMIIVTGLIMMISEDSDAGLIDEGILVSRDAIIIVDNDDFTSDNGVVRGSGIESDPYIIENWTMDYRNGEKILIDGTTAHVEIINCMIGDQSNAGPAINLINTSNVSIINCSFYNIGIGIIVQRNCNGIKIENTFFNSSREGIIIENCNEIIMANNTFLRNEKGINIEGDSNGTNIFRNIFIGNEYESIFIKSSGNISIEENSFVMGTDDHPYILSDDYNPNNVVIIMDTKDSIVKKNNFSDIDGGLIIERCERIYVEENKFHRPMRNEYYDRVRLGLQVMNTKWSRISGNNYYNCGFLFIGKEKEYYLTNEISSNNLVDGDPTLVITNKTTLPEIGDDFGQIMFINCSDMEISGLSMRTAGIAVCIAYCENISITYNGIEDSEVGFYILGGKNIEFRNNNFLHCNIGNVVLQVNNFSATNCNYNRCLIGMTLFVYNSSIYDNSFVIVNQSIDLRGNDNKILENYIAYGENGMDIHGSRNFIFNNSIRNIRGQGGIRIDDDLWIDDEYGVPPQMNLVYNNTLRTCDPGISVPGTGNFIFNNTIRNGTNGIEIYGTENEIFSNRIFENNGTGIHIEYHENVIRLNNISNNQFGIKIQDEARDNVISKNFIHQNGWYGIQLDEEAFNNTIISNNISENNGHGVRILDGCFANRIHKNEFWYNNGLELQAYDDGDNLWDDGFELGNFWTDYRKIFGDRASNDGVVWNISYDIDGSANAEDRYPLVGNYQEPERELFINMENVLDAYTGVQYSVEYSVYYHRLYFDNITWNLATNASWLSFNNSWYLIGIPGSNDAGSYWVNLTVTAEGLTDFTNFTLTVHSEYVSPTIIGVDLTTINEDTYYDADYNHAGDGTPTWSLTTESDFLTVHSSTGILSGTPDNDDVGTYWVNVSLFDGQNLSDFRNFTLTVNNVNDPPDEVEFDIGGFVFDEDSDQVISIDVSDPDSSYGDILNITWTIDGIGVVGYGENIELDLSDGNYTLTVRVTDGNGSWVESSTSVLIEEKEISDSEFNYRTGFIILLVLMIILIFVIITLMIFRRKAREGPEEMDNSGGHVSSRGPGRMRKDLDLEPSIDVFRGSIDDPLDEDMMEEPEFSEEPFEFEELDMMELREQVLKSGEGGRIPIDEMENELLRIVDEGIISEEEYDLILEKLKPGAFQSEE